MPLSGCLRLSIATIWFLATCAASRTADAPSQQTAQPESLFLRKTLCQGINSHPGWKLNFKTKPLKTHKPRHKPSLKCGSPAAMANESPTRWTTWRKQPPCWKSYAAPMICSLPSYTLTCVSAGMLHALGVISLETVPPWCSIVGSSRTASLLPTSGTRNRQQTTYCTRLGIHLS